MFWELSDCIQEQLYDMVLFDTELKGNTISTGRNYKTGYTKVEGGAVKLCI